MTPEREEMLDRCLDLIREGKDPEVLLVSDPAAAAEVRPLLSVARDLHSLPPAEPTGDAMATLATGLSTRQAPRRYRTVLAWAAVVLFAVVLVGWGTSAASANATPGDVLYPVKMLGERVKLFLTFSRTGQVEMRIVLSEERLREALKMQAGGKGIDTAVLKRMLDEAKAAIDETPQVPPASRGYLATRVASMTSYQRTALSELTAHAGPGEKAELAPIMTRCSEQCMAACTMFFGYCPHASVNSVPGPGTCPLHPAVDNAR